MIKAELANEADVTEYQLAAEGDVIVEIVSDYEPAPEFKEDDEGDSDNVVSQPETEEASLTPEGILDFFDNAELSGQVFEPIPDYLSTQQMPSLVLPTIPRVGQMSPGSTLNAHLNRAYQLELSLSKRWGV